MGAAEASCSCPLQWTYLNLDAEIVILERSLGERKGQVVSPQPPSLHCVGALLSPRAFSKAPMVTVLTRKPGSNPSPIPREC